MTKFEEENVWAMTTDHKSTLLIAGDTAGYMYVFDISRWCCNSNKVQSATLCHHYYHCGQYVTIARGVDVMAGSCC